ncbi:hypothetical protein ACIQWQ_11400 [Peribacillus frigoritolerans]
MLMKSRDRLCNSKSVDIVKCHFCWDIGISYKVLDSSRIITDHKGRTSERGKFVLEDELIIRLSSYVSLRIAGKY